MRIAILLFFLNTFGVFCQFSDDFTDGDFTNNPTWGGEDVKFIVNGVNELQLDAPAVTEDAYLSTPSQAIENATWEFHVRLDFNPSGSNYGLVYLVSNNANLKGTLDGYYVLIGGADDKISLFRQDGTSTSEIIAGVPGSVDAGTVDVYIRVTRDAAGNWELERDTVDAGATYISEGTVFDDTYFQSFYFGVYCDYTSTRSDKFFYEQFTVTGDPYNDVTPPGLLDLTVISQTELDVLFDEPMDQASVENINNYSANNGLGTPSNAVIDGGNAALVHLTFANAFQDGAVNTLDISNVEDISGNSAPTLQGDFFFYVPGVPDAGDVRINEIMFKENPSVGLPLVEYVELYNVSNKSFEINNWRIYNDNSGGTVQDFVLVPGAYVVVHASSGLDSFPSVNNINATSFPSLKNDGDHIFLYNSDESLLIDDFVYTVDMLQDEDKEDGGYSLEMINPLHPCNDEDNWRASVSPLGGTPGEENSIYDITPGTENPTIVNSYVASSTKLIVVFSLGMDSVNFDNAGISFTPNLSWNWEFPFNDQKTVLFNFDNPLEAGVFYTLEIDGNATDCFGNALLNGNVEFALPQEAEFNDIVINEVLFNPFTGSREFVEVYNKSDKVISLTGWQLANKDDDEVANEKIITLDPIVMMPGDFMVMTRDTASVQNEYPAAVKGNFIEMESVPSYTNTEGTVYVLNSLNEVIDSFSYHEDMHFPVIRDPKGKSLERISPERASDDETNWQTAAEKVGFATPGYENSQRFDANYTGTVTTEPEIFSPNNDGVDDVLNINYTFENGGNVANIEVYDAAGRMIKSIKQNEYLGTQGTYSWDGRTEKGEKARVGHYVILFKIFNEAGDTEVYKATCVLATQF